jgi:hypothetical protein
MTPLRLSTRFTVLLRNALVLGTLSAVLVSVTNACQCSKIAETPCNSLSDSDVIFLGTVESIENRPWSEFWLFSKTYSFTSLRNRLAMFRDEVIVNFSVEEIYRDL